MTPTRLLVVTATLVSSTSMLLFGVWAYLVPKSFSAFIDYQPYNEHLIHDAGAFQVGLGVAILLAVFFADTIVISLGGFVVASTLHTLSHYTDRHIGGHSSDVPGLGLLTVIAVIGLGVHVWDRRRQHLRQSDGPRQPTHT